MVFFLPSIISTAFWCTSQQMLFWLSPAVVIRKYSGCIRASPEPFVIMSRSSFFVTLHSKKVNQLIHRIYSTVCLTMSLWRRDENGRRQARLPLANSLSRLLLIVKQLSRHKRSSGGTTQDFSDVVASESANYHNCEVFRDCTKHRQNPIPRHKAFLLMWTKTALSARFSGCWSIFPSERCHTGIRLGSCFA